MYWKTSKKYGAFVAESSFGFTIWARTEQELLALFK